MTDATTHYADSEKSTEGMPASSPSARELLVDLVRMPSVDGREGVIAHWCAGLLREAGYEVTSVPFGEGRDQLVAVTGIATRPPITLTGHLDTVPATATDWRVDPWSATVEGDRLTGRGASDMKSGVAAILAAVARHAAHHRAAAHDQAQGNGGDAGPECTGVQVILTAGEETGCRGSAEIPASALRRGGPLLVAEPTANALVPRHKGAHWMRLSARGRAAHGSAPHLGDNAAVRLARAAVALHDYDDWPTSETHGDVTANVGILRGGERTNVVADAAQLHLDMRSVPGADPESLRAAVTKVVDGAIEKPGSVDVEDEVVLPPLDTPLDDPFVEECARALRAAGLPDAVQADAARFFTDASVLADLLAVEEPGQPERSGQSGRSGQPQPVPTVILGPGEPDQCHVVDEWCSLTRLDEAVEVYVALLDARCGLPVLTDDRD